MTQWYFEDDVCWIAECEFCSVPMVVWKSHDASPPDDVKADLHQKLSAVVDEHFDWSARGFYIDDNMRNIPDHYHAHARPRFRSA
jgi:hypothetical protein